MFSLIRRISHSVIPRPDRPWDDDATSNAPKVGRKRRLSSTDRDAEDEQDESSKKKIKEDTPLADPAEESSRQTPVPQAESVEVKEVTKGVKEVELEDKEKVSPESVPLPDEVSGELDETTAAPVASVPPPTEPQTDAQTDAPAVDVQPSEKQEASESTAETEPTTTEAASVETAAPDTLAVPVQPSSPKVADEEVPKASLVKSPKKGTETTS